MRFDRASGAAASCGFVRASALLLIAVGATSAGCTSTEETAECFAHTDCACGFACANGRCEPSSESARACADTSGDDAADTVAADGVCARLFHDQKLVVERHFAEPAPATVWLKLVGTSIGIQDADLRFSWLRVEDGDGAPLRTDDFTMATDWQIGSGGIGSATIEGGFASITADWGSFLLSGQGFATADGLSVTVTVDWGETTNSAGIVFATEPVDSSDGHESWAYALFNMGKYDVQQDAPYADFMLLSEQLPHVALEEPLTAGVHSFEATLRSGPCE